MMDSELRKQANVLPALTLFPKGILYPVISPPRAIDRSPITAPLFFNLLQIVFLFSSQT